ncbi:DNA translocase FtsK [Neptuniibacter sp. CAU 1671]|uniref:DNA translocase FtsK n=1 Tax=Neptuniibacter sp. CAU 1671 TaxID=3032593 RepID=UPI0023DCE729|nr:DNA translocase FtsK [Neptuniibacter sp. CAU 1671]
MSDTPKRLSFPELLMRIGRESSLILVVALNLLLLLALIGYDPRDPGWSHLGYQPEVRNFIGPVGAWLADLSVSAFGIGAYLLPILIVYPTVRFMLRRRATLLESVPYFILRCSGSLALLLTFSALAATHLSVEALHYPFSAGGIVGEALSDWFVSWFSLTGSSVVLFSGLLLSLTLMLELSWAQLLESLGLWCMRLPNIVLQTVESRSVANKTVKPVTAGKPQTPPTQSIETDPVRTEPVMPQQVETEFDEDDSPPWTEETVPVVTNISTTPSPVQEVVTDKGHVKIVPLSETHKPMQDKELGLEPEQVSAARKVARRRIPPLDLLDPPTLNTNTGYSQEELERLSSLLEDKLKDFGVIAEVVEVNPGPVITRFEIQPAPGVKASKITNLAKDLARSMAVSSVRVVEVIAGKSVVGVEIPNETRQTVHLSEVLSSKPYMSAASKLTLGLGNDIAGNPVVANLAKMPHLLVAGTTGSGKSVGVNAMLLSLLFKATPEEVRLILVDPKMLELSIYEGIPHLLAPVITDMKDAASGLRWCVGEMERRYRLMAKMGVRNLAGFNEKLEEARKQGAPLRDPLWNPEEHGEPFGTPAPELEPLPYIVVVIDEFADMMMIVGKKVEELIARIAQKARAAGIHLILATQRPSVDVITGLIKANIPTRIAFQVSSKIDSRTILDQGGAENLLGWGDMLYLPAGVSLPNRVHGAFVSDDEVHRVVDAWKKLGAPDYITDLTEPEAGIGGDGLGSGSGSLFDDEQDPLYDEAVAFVLETRKASISSVQRKLKIGYNRAARMIETMEAAGVVSEAGTNGQREVLAPGPHGDR